MNISELKALAEAATPGKWVAKGSQIMAEYLTCIREVLFDANSGAQQEGWEQQRERDAAFIAAANPAVVLELIKLLKTEGAMRACCNEICNGLLERANKAEAQRGELLAMLANVKRTIENSDHWWMDSPDRGGFDLEAITAAIAKCEVQS